MRDVNTQITVIYLFDFALSSIHAAWGLLPVLKLFAFSSVKIPIIALNAATAGSCGSSVARYYLNRKKWCWNQKKKKNCRNDKDFDATCFGMFSLLKNKNKASLFIHTSQPWKVQETWESMTTRSMASWCRWVTWALLDCVQVCVEARSKETNKNDRISTLAKKKIRLQLLHENGEEARLLENTQQLSLAGCEFTEDVNYVHYFHLRYKQESIHMQIKL